MGRNPMSGHPSEASQNQDKETGQKPREQKIHILKVCGEGLPGLMPT